MKKVSILALHLGYGGIENAIVSLANNLSKKYIVEIVSTYELYDKPAFDINNNVKVKYLKRGFRPNKENLKKSIKGFHIFSFIKEVFTSIKVLYLRKKLMVDYIKKCDSDIIISARDFHNKWLGKYGKKNTVKISWEHNHHHGNERYAKKVINSIKNVDVAVFVSKNLSDFYASRSKCVCEYIPNMLSFESKYVSDLSSKNLVSVGRLSSEKGFSDLIDVFKLVHEKNNDIKLNIVGDGAEREKIKSKILDYGLEESVIMHGFKDPSYINKLLLDCSLYVMTSFTESFGIVLIEAMDAGVPVIAFDSAEGALDLIDGQNGVLVKNRDFEKMASEIVRLMNDKDLRLKMGKYCKTFASNYNSLNVMKKWFDLLER